MHKLVYSFVTLNVHGHLKRKRAADLLRFNTNTNQYKFCEKSVQKFITQKYI